MEMKLLQGKTPRTIKTLIIEYLIINVELKDTNNYVNTGNIKNKCSPQEYD